MTSDEEQPRTRSPFVFAFVPSFLMSDEDDDDDDGESITQQPRMAMPSLLLLWHNSSNADVRIVLSDLWSMYIKLVMIQLGDGWVGLFGVDYWRKEVILEESVIACTYPLQREHLSTITPFLCLINHNDLKIFEIKRFPKHYKWILRFFMWFLGLDKF